MLKNTIFGALALGAAMLATPVLAQGSPALGSWATEAVTDFGTFKATMTVAEANVLVTGSRLAHPRSHSVFKMACAVACVRSSARTTSENRSRAFPDRARSSTTSSTRAVGADVDPRIA